MTEYTIAKIAVAAISIYCLWMFAANIVNDGYYYEHLTSDPTRKLSSKEKAIKFLLQLTLWIVP